MILANRNLRASRAPRVLFCPARSARSASRLFTYHLFAGSPVHRGTIHDSLLDFSLTVNFADPRMLLSREVFFQKE
jgi:hypothetical protein